MNDDREREAGSSDRRERDPAQPPENGIDWRVLIGVGIAIAGFIVAILLGTLG